MKEEVCAYVVIAYGGVTMTTGSSKNGA